ncbi:FlgO family outer membrane protein [Desulfovibrio inopinatus]|uniref:FlgO family outer membrane protein n=1 Tax=Desulfovibrio inopinatus TaxID=102109 RepID=UPI0004190B8B|nr:FlgO family outer membrane protein [Desulfovibrio inopinatus]
MRIRQTPAQRARPVVSLKSTIMAGLFFLLVSCTPMQNNMVKYQAGSNYGNGNASTAQRLQYWQVAQSLARDLDSQIARRMLLGGDNSRGLYWVVVTVPVNLNDLTQTSPLGRLMAQEVGSALVQLGYNVQEIRKGSDIVFNPKQGEFILTRDVNQLLNRGATSTLVVAGTYTQTSQGVRFNMEVLNAWNNNVIAASSRTQAYTPAVASLIGDGGGGVVPSVRTRPDYRTLRQQIPSFLLP